MSNLSFVSGSINRSVTTSNTRLLRVDDDGRLEVVASFGAIQGVAGDDTTLNPFRQIDFRPQPAKGSKTTFGAASLAIGPLDIDKTYHIFSTQICWINTGGAAVVAAAGDTAIQNGAVYEYIPKTAGVDDYIGVIQDTAGGDIFVSRVED